MKDSKNEVERIKLNRKLLKSTFFSEIKDKKIEFKKAIIDICTIFIAFFFADLIGEFFSISSFFIRLGIVFIIGTAIGLLSKRIEKILNKNLGGKKMALYDLKTLLSENSYPGRGIVIGKSADGKNAMIAYFIMGRSENSRNRVFEAFDGGMRTKAFDESKLSDPSLIIYNPYLKLGDTDIVTNGDQTNTIYDFLKEGATFEDALYTREFEPDAPNFTPRISGALYYGFAKQMFTYKLSILKSSNGRPEACNRYFYNYVPENGIGHFIHTYKCDGNPIPSFYGEPEEVALPNTAEELADMVWNNLNVDNKVSLFVRTVPLDGSEPTDIIINKNK